MLLDKSNFKGKERKSLLPSKIIIKKKVKLNKIVANVSYRYQTNKRDYILLLKFINDVNKNEAIFATPKIIQQRFLPIPLTGIKTLLRRLEEIHLLKIEHYSQDRDLINDNSTIKLTEQGNSAINEEAVYIPAEEPLEIWFIDDPIFPEYFHTIKRPKTGTSKQKSHNFAKLNETYNSFNKFLGKKINAVINFFEKGSIIIDEIENEVLVLDDSSFVTIKIELNNNDDIKSAISPNNKIPKNANMANYPSELKLEFIEIYNSIISSTSKKWFNGTYYLEKVENLKDIELKSFKKERLILKDMVLPKVENVKEVAILDIPLQPENNEEAEKWFKKLLLLNIDEYLTEKEFITLSESLKSRFISVPPEKIPTPSIVDFADYIKDTTGHFSSKFWFLMAPFDLHGVD